MSLHKHLAAALRAWRLEADLQQMKERLHHRPITAQQLHWARLCQGPERHLG